MKKESELLRFLFALGRLVQFNEIKLADMVDQSRNVTCHGSKRECGLQSEMLLSRTIPSIGWKKYKQKLRRCLFDVLPTMRQMRLEQETVAWFQEVSLLLDGVSNTSL